LDALNFSQICGANLWAANRLVNSRTLVSLKFYSTIPYNRLEVNTNLQFNRAVDVNIYGSAGTDALRGNHENIEIGQFLQEYLNVDVKAITDELAEKSKTFSISTAQEISWTGREPTAEDLSMVEKHYEHLYGEVP
jgi:alkaline phosphatase